MLQIQQISKSYGKHRVLEKVEFKVEQGRVLGLLGPNGAGKSTLLRIINQIVRPDEGRMLLHGQDLHLGDVLRFGYLPEERGLYPKMSVDEQLLYLAQLKGKTRSQAQKHLDYWLEKLELTAWRKQAVEKMSKGMQQKVQFIATVLHEPEILIFDEPFSGFDPLNAEMLKQEILAQKAQGKTLIFSTHNMESVEALCDDVVLINKGRVVVESSVGQLRKQFSKPLYTLVTNVPLEGTLQTCTIRDCTCHSERWHYHLQKKDDTAISAMLHELLAQGVEISSFAEDIPTMHEIFLQLIDSHA